MVVCIEHGVPFITIHYNQLRATVSYYYYYIFFILRHNWINREREKKKPWNDFCYGAILLVTDQRQRIDTVKAIIDKKSVELFKISLIWKRLAL